jgi:hypothetical protein
VGIELIGGDIPGAAVDDEDWGTSHRKGIVAVGGRCVGGLRIFN